MKSYLFLFNFMSPFSRKKLYGGEKQYIGSFFDLFAELIEAFHNHRCIYFPFHHARIQLVVPIQKT